MTEMQLWLSVLFVFCFIFLYISVSESLPIVLPPFTCTLTGIIACASCFVPAIYDRPIADLHTLIYQIVVSNNKKKLFSTKMAIFAKNKTTK